MFLALVPVRGGSKGVPRKNMRLVDGRPLLDFTLRAVRDSGVADRLIVSSDDPQILGWATARGYECLPRAAHLSGDEATISDVAAAVADELDWEGTVGVFQATSPLRTAESIVAAVERFAASGADSLASCVREPHLFWYDSPEGSEAAPEPLFAARVNRQYARSRVLRETGSIQLVRSSVLRRTRQMVAPRHELFEVPDDEALDIDTHEDLAVARRRLERATVIFRLRANRRVGSGHLFHCLQLADELEDCDLRFLLVDCDPFVGELLDGHGYAWRTETDQATDLEQLRGGGVGVVINDVLDTTEAEVLVGRSAGFVVVNVEDLGPGARLAHWVVNALYRADAPHGNTVSGPRFATLRDEFHGLPPKRICGPGTRILITFGGTDPNHLAQRCAALLSADPSYRLRVIVGPGAAPATFPEGVEVLRHVRDMAAEMAAADLIVTSAGRTVYEAAAVGTPVVVLAQNAREATHAHLGYETGVVFLGIGPLVDDQHITGTVGRLVENAELRRELSDRLRRSIDTRGSARIASHIRTLILEHA